MKEQLFAIALAIITTCLLFMLRHFIITAGKCDENQRRARARGLEKAGNSKLKAGEGLNDSPKTVPGLNKQSTHASDAQPGGAAASKLRLGGNR